MKEMSGREPPDKSKVKPLFFLKLAAHAIIGPDASVRLPAYSKEVDWEAELAVVIGRPARNISVADAMSHVAGYTIINDLSLRDQGQRSDWNVLTDFLSGKSFDTGAPMGPWLVPARQVPDVYNLSIKQWVGQELMQDFQHRADAFHHRRADRVSRRQVHPAPGRRDRDRLAGRQRAAARDLPQARPGPHGRDRRDRAIA